MSDVKFVSRDVQTPDGVRKEREYILSHNNVFGGVVRFPFVLEKNCDEGLLHTYAKKRVEKVRDYLDGLSKKIDIKDIGVL